MGIKPTDKLLSQWGELTQGDKETVRKYYERFAKLKELLSKADQPVTLDERVQYRAFVGQTHTTGLLPPIQRHVKLQGKDTVEEALAAAHVRCEHVKPA